MASSKKIKRPRYAVRYGADDEWFAGERDPFAWFNSKSDAVGFRDMIASPEVPPFEAFDTYSGRVLA